AGPATAREAGVAAAGGMGRGSSGAPRPPEPVRQPVSVTLGRYSALILFALFIVIFGALKPHLFLTVSTFRLTFGEGVVTAVLALAFLVPLAAGVFDLSIGAMMGLSLVVINWFAANTGVPIALVCTGAVLLCCLVGLISGFLVVRLRVNSLIATLGVSQVLTAVGLKVSDNRQITGAFSDRFATLGSTNLLGVPVVVLYLLVLAVIGWFVLEHTPAGRYLFAVGSSPDAARLAGLSTERLVYGSLVASGAVAGIAGVIYAMRVGAYTADAGPGLLFPALAAVFFGASQFSRRPNVWGTLIAYFALAFGVKGLQLAFGPGTFWIQPLFQGVALLIAVSLASRQVAQTRRSRRAQAATTATEPAVTTAAEP
ncbi:ABC transporter permease, partial [Frankia sp. CiP3]|uniref:ABC transporter permease n=1 Tax=Frankia sp. CiP3 TaxID=2880971 RepID=UPI001EF4E632